LDLAERCRARVKIVDVLPEVPRLARRFVTRGIERELVQDRRTRLEALAHGHTSAVPTSVAVLRGNPVTALAEEVLRDGTISSFVPHQRDLAPEPKPFRPIGPIDMRLLRSCPCPVWLVGPRPLDDQPPILACLDVVAPDPGIRG
jgi:hypothetical protein